MLERNLAALFRGFATEIESHRTAFMSLCPEAEELLAELDDLIALLLRYSPTRPSHRDTSEEQH